MGSSVSKYKDDMSDREIMNSKYPKKIQEFIDDEINQTIVIFEEKYPELAEEFQNIQEEQ